MGVFATQWSGILEEHRAPGSALKQAANTQLTLRELLVKRYPNISGGNH